MSTCTNRWPRRSPPAGRSWRSKARSSRMACPIPQNSVMAANVEKIIAAGRRYARHHRRHRRQDQDRPVGRRAGVACAGRRGDEAVARRPRLRGRRGPHRRHDGRGDDDRRAHGRHQGVRDGRHRRRAQGRGGKLRHLGRSRRTGAHACHRGVGRRQGDPRHREDAGGPGDARRAGRGGRIRRDAGLLVAPVALSRAAQGRRSGGHRAAFLDAPRARAGGRHADRQSGARKRRDTGRHDGVLHRGRA